MDVTMLRRIIMSISAPQQESGIINLCPAATGTEIQSKFTLNGNNYQYVITGLDPNQEYTLQATWTRSFTSINQSLFLILFGAESKALYPTRSDVFTPFTKSVTEYPTSNGTLTISISRSAFNQYSTVPNYAQYIINIMLEKGSVAHDFVPYIEN